MGFEPALYGPSNRSTTALMLYASFSIFAGMKFAPPGQNQEEEKSPTTKM